MKRIIALFVFMLTFCALSGAAFADNDNTETIYIRTAEELAAINGSGYYILQEDIDLEGFDWQGISNFSGKLYGKGHTIKNLKSDKCGLFERLGSGAKIMDLRLENVEIGTQTKMLGGIVSYVPSSAKDVSIENCSVSGVLNTLYDNSNSKLNFCGAIAGVVASEDCSIKYCSSNATVEAVLGEGGIVGINHGKIYGSFFTGSIRCAKNNWNFVKPDEEGAYVEVYYISSFSGGIAGTNYGKISECAVILNDFDTANYFGLICGVNIAGSGNAKDCFTPSSFDLSKYDNWHYSKTANVLTAKEYSKLLKKDDRKTADPKPELFDRSKVGMAVDTTFKSKSAFELAAELGMDVNPEDFGYYVNIFHKESNTGMVVFNEHICGEINTSKRYVILIEGGRIANVYGHDTDKSVDTDVVMSKYEELQAIPEVNAAAPTGENVLKVEEGYVFDYSDGTLTYMRIIWMEDEEGIMYDDTYEITV